MHHAILPIRFSVVVWDSQELLYLFVVFISYQTDMSYGRLFCLFIPRILVTIEIISMKIGLFEYQVRHHISNIQFTCKRRYIMTNIFKRYALLTMAQNGANIIWLVIDIWAASCQNQQNDFAPSEESDQPGHPPSLIRVFAVRSMGS